MKHPDIVSIATSAGALIAILSLMPVTANGQAAANDKAKANARPRGAPFLRQLTLFERKDVTVAPEILAKYAGTYVLFGVDAVFTLEGNRLIRQWGQDPKEPLLAQSEKDFFFNNTSGEIEFVQDGTGRVTHLLFYQGGPAAKAPRK